jgi:hypothetical protein
MNSGVYIALRCFIYLTRERGMTIAIKCEAITGKNRVKMSPIKANLQ